MNTEFIIILILFAYIAFLHYQLSIKTKIIQSFLDKQNKSIGNLDHDSIAQILKKLQSVSTDNYLRQNKLFDEDILKFILGNENTQNSFIHYTKEEDVANRIITEGFRFVDSFYKTAETVTNDKLDMVYKHYLHKHYGKYVIIIGISKSIYSKYVNEISKLKRLVNVEQILSERSPELDENQDEVYLLPNQFVKGYINSETGDITHNKAFNPDYDPPFTQENIKRVL